MISKTQDETGVYKNLLQETSHRAGLKLPVYTTVRSGPGHGPVFSCTVELAGVSFTGEPAKTKKQAQKNAALAAWSALKKRMFFPFFFPSLFRVLWLCFSCPTTRQYVSFAWLAHPIKIRKKEGNSTNQMQYFLLSFSIFYRFYSILLLLLLFGLQPQWNNDTY